MHINKVKSVYDYPSRITIGQGINSIPKSLGDLEQKNSGIVIPYSEMIPLAIAFTPNYFVPATTMLLRWVKKRIAG